MNTLVKDGDEITVAANGTIERVMRTSAVLHAVVVGPTFYRGTDRSFRWRYETVEGWTSDEEEGVAWIRGHHAPTSPESIALRAAWTLR